MPAAKRPQPVQHEAVHRILDGGPAGQPRQHDGAHFEAPGALAEHQQECRECRHDGTIKREVGTVRRLAVFQRE